MWERWKKVGNEITFKNEVLLLLCGSTVGTKLCIAASAVWFLNFIVPLSLHESFVHIEAHILWHVVLWLKPSLKWPVEKSWVILLGVDSTFKKHFPSSGLYLSLLAFEACGIHTQGHLWGDIFMLELAWSRWVICDGQLCKEETFYNLSGSHQYYHECKVSKDFTDCDMQFKKHSLPFFLGSHPYFVL